MRGCLVVIVLFFALGLAEYGALYYTPMAGSFGLPIASAVLITLFVTNVWGVMLWIKRETALRRPPSSWQDGQLVGFSGRITSVREPLPAPASGTPSAIYEYTLRQVRRMRDNEGGSNEVAAFDGMGMSGCVVQGGAQRFGLIGFPILTDVGKNRLSTPEAFQRIASHLLSSTVKPKPAGIGKMLREYGEVLDDADGIVRFDQGSFAEFDLSAYRGRYREDPDGAVSELAAYLAGDDFFVEETVVPENVEVTVFGRYRASDRTINVGSGMKHLEHGLALGPAAKVSGKGLRSSSIMLVIFGTLTALLHLWVGPPLLASASAERYRGEHPVTFEQAIATKLGNSRTRGDLVQFAQDGDARAIRLLVGFGADPNRTSGSIRPLQQARSADAIAALLDGGAEVDAVDDDGHTALASAVERNDIDGVNLLIAHRANVNAADKWGHTPLIRAAVYGHLDIGRALIAAKADANQRAKDGTSALDEARANGHDDFAQFLLTTGEARESEVTERDGAPVQPGDATARVAEAYLTALHARDTARLGALQPSMAGYDWSSTDWDTLLSGWPTHAEQVVGFANGARATLRVRGLTSEGKRALEIGFALVRDPAQAGDELDGWRIEREWIEWGELERAKARS